jgi:hypothetical protein
MNGVFDFLGRNKWLMQVGAVLTGFWGAAVVNPWLGILAVALGVISMIVSGLGMRWDILSGQQKALVVPGLVIGYVGLGLFIFLLYIMWTAFISVVSEL